MQKAAGRMQTLINELLSFSRVTTKAQPFQPVNLAEVAAGVLDDLEGRIELVKGRVEVGALPVIDAEPVQMRQLLQNLIGNALKFRAEDRKPLIHLTAKNAAGEWTFAVRDNGIGIEPQYFERIFRVFQRLHTRERYPGTGIGLAICKKIVDRHGGRIWIESQPGQGSTFYFTLPDRKPTPPSP
jgi:light-regulated signal transduction histidine kinase (bacteriophytochrome)